MLENRKRKTIKKYGFDSFSISYIDISSKMSTECNLI